MLKINILKVSRFNTKVPVVYSDRNGLIFGLISANYIQWRVVANLVDYSTQKMRDLAFNFHTVFSGVTEQLPL